MTKTDNLISLKTLLWIDGFAALLSGVLMLTLKNIVSPIFNLPENLLTFLAIVSLAYSPFSIYLAKQKSNSKQLMTILVLANSIYAFFCFILAIYFHKTATLIGIGYLLFDSIVVATLAILEQQKIKYITS
jgi:hypothetical protein